ncbi:hypothetical protein ABW20_dc0106767 [Dactylellina cionopaga]|nr:hypothetical protein ABW20_dc0106767 [Dactylellina cionopaga]
MPIPASRRVISSKWCPSCSLALLRAFASVCGTQLPPARRIGRNGYRSLSLASSRAKAKAYKSSGVNEARSGILGTRRFYATYGNKANDYDNGDEGDAKFARTVDELESEGRDESQISWETHGRTEEDGEFSKIYYRIEQKVHWSAQRIGQLRTEAMARKVDELVAPTIQEVLHDMEMWNEEFEEDMKAGSEEQKKVVRDIEIRLEQMRKKARQQKLVMEADMKEDSVSPIQFVQPRDSVSGKIDVLQDAPEPIDDMSKRIEDLLNALTAKNPDTKVASLSSAILGVMEDPKSQGDPREPIKEQKSPAVNKDDTISIVQPLPRNSTAELNSKTKSAEGPTELEQGSEEIVSSSTKFGIIDGVEVEREKSRMEQLRTQMEEQEMLMDELESQMKDLDDSSNSLGEEESRNLQEKLASELSQVESSWEALDNELNAEEKLNEEAMKRREMEEEENIEYRTTEPPASPNPSDGSTPWYLQSALQPAPRRFISPLIEQMPQIPPNPPPNFENLLNYLIKDLSLSKLKIMDLRGVEPTPALGSNVLMILATARSERHMSIAADKCCRFMRGIISGTHIYADGLIGRGVVKLRERREQRKGKRRSADDEEGMKVGWICVNSGTGIVVQVMTGWRREELNLEGLWSRKINTSQKRKLRERLLAEGFGAQEIKDMVAREIGDELDEAPEYDAEEDAAEARIVEAKLMVSEILPPLEDGSKGEMEEFQDSLKVTEMHSKSKKKEQGKRYIDIPAVKQKKLSWKDKEKQLNGVAFSTKDPFSKSSRSYSTVVEAVNTLNYFPFLGSYQSADLAAGRLVQTGKYKELLKLYPRPRTNSQTTMVLLAHLNHLVLTPPEIATKTLLTTSRDHLYLTPFFTSFKLSLPQTPTATHNHIQTLLHLSAHNISPLLYPLKKYVRMPAEIMESGQQVPLVTYHIILRSLATSAALRGDHPKSVNFWINRTSDTLAVMSMFLLRKMDLSGIDVGHDPEVFESLWLAMSPRDTLEYVADLGDATKRSGKIDRDKPFSRALDHRLELYQAFHMRWYDPYRFIPASQDLRRGKGKREGGVGNEADEEILGQYLHKSLVYPPERPVNRYSVLPSYLVTMFVTVARAGYWRELKHLWRWLPTTGVMRPKTLYALYLELLAREANVKTIIEGLRFILADYEREFSEGRGELTDGVSEGVLGCVEFIEREVPGTGGEFGRWKRQCESFLGKGKDSSSLQGDYTYVI